MKWNMTFNALILTTGLLAACAPGEADKVGEAQLCIDTAAQGQAAACLEKISGIETPAAYTLRCSAGFIDEGFTQPARFKSAFDQLSAGGGSSTEAFLGVLSFTAKGTLDLNVAAATTTYNNCAKSEGKALKLLGSMANTATNLAKVAGALNPSTGDITTAINNLVDHPSDPGNPEVIAAVGTAISTTYTASCKSGQQADASLCEQLDAALVGKDLSDSAAIGQAVLAYWKAH
jgi:hypothetical protein